MIKLVIIFFIIFFIILILSVLMFKKTKSNYYNENFDIEQNNPECKKINNITSMEDIALY